MVKVFSSGAGLMIGVAGEAGGGLRGACVRVGGVVHRQGLLQAAGAGHGRAARRLRQSAVGHARRAGHGRHRHGLLDGEGLLVRARLMIGVAGEAGRRVGRACVRVGGVVDRQGLLQAADARHRRGARRLCRSAVSHARRAGHGRHRHGLLDGEGLIVCARLMIGVTGEAGRGVRGAGVRVAGVVHRQGLLQAAGAVDRRAAGRLRRPGIQSPSPGRSRSSPTRPARW